MLSVGIFLGIVSSQKHLQRQSFLLWAIGYDYRDVSGLPMYLVIIFSFNGKYPSSL